MISFIVPAHNEQLHLPRTLGALHRAAQTTPQAYEIIVVDDASTDQTAQIALAEKTRLVQVNCRKISAVRNAGARQAAGDILIFVDADTVLPPPTLQAALRALERGIVGGGAHLRFDGQVPRLMRLLSAAFLGVWFSMRWAAGCFIFARRSAFEAAGGFDERYYAAEELFLSEAMKRQGRFVILPQKVITSGRKMRSTSALRQLTPAFWSLLKGRSALQQQEGLDVFYQWDRSNDTLA